MDKNVVWAMVCLAFMAVLFGAWALYLGYDTVIIGAVLAFLGTVAGYIYGKKEEKESSEA